MSLLVELRTEKGEVLGRAGEIDGAIPAYLPDFENDRFPTIRFIDRYGDTVFNSLQMNAVLPELRQLRERARSDGEKKVVDGIIELAEECAKGAHRYLVFVGD